MTSTIHKRAVALPAALLAGALLLSACGGSPSSSMAGDHGMSPSSTSTSSSAAAGAASSSSSPTANDADAIFATMMIPHHAQAVEMAKLAATRAGSDKVKELASKIEGAQQPEIDLMSGWLKSWGKPVPAVSGMSGMSGTGHGSMDMGSRMMTEAEMKQLQSANGAAFDKLFLTMMIKHHQGAITMAQDEVKNGQNQDAVALAKKITADQTGEITTMKALLQR